MGNSSNLYNNITAAHKDLITSISSIIAESLVLSTFSHELVAIAHKIEERFKELEKKEEELQKREEEVVNRSKKLDERENGLKEKKLEVGTHKQMQTSINGINIEQYSFEVCLIDLFILQSF